MGTETTETKTMGKGKLRICIMRVQERKEREKRAENLFVEIMVENLANLRKEMDIHIEETQRTLTVSIQRPPLRHYNQTVKDKEKISKAA